MLAKTLNGTLIQWLTDLHCPGAAAPKISWEVREPEDLLNESKKDQAVFSLGFEPSEDYIQEKYGVGWTKKAAPKQSPIPVIPDPAANADPFAVPAPAFAESADDPVDALANQLEAASAKAMEQLLVPVRRLVKSAGSLTEIRDGILDLYPHMGTAAFAEILTQAFLAADLAGRARVHAESRPGSKDA
jgi:phage gp29-like protein